MAQKQFNSDTLCFGGLLTINCSHGRWSGQEVSPLSILGEHDTEFAAHARKSGLLDELAERRRRSPATKRWADKSVNPSFLYKRIAPMFSAKT